MYNKNDVNVWSSISQALEGKMQYLLTLRTACACSVRDRSYCGVRYVRGTMIFSGLTGGAAVAAKYGERSP